jgi:hypothetical protein
MDAYTDRKLSVSLYCIFFRAPYEQPTYQDWDELSNSGDMSDSEQPRNHTAWDKHSNSKHHKSFNRRALAATKSDNCPSVSGTEASFSRLLLLRRLLLARWNWLGP